MREVHNRIRLGSSAVWMAGYVAAAAASGERGWTLAIFVIVSAPLAALSDKFLTPYLLVIQNQDDSPLAVRRRRIACVTIWAMVVAVFVIGFLTTPS